MRFREHFIHIYLQDCTLDHASNTIFGLVLQNRVMTAAKFKEIKLKLVKLQKSLMLTKKGKNLICDLISRKKHSGVIFTHIFDHFSIIIFISIMTKKNNGDMSSGT